MAQERVRGNTFSIRVFPPIFRVQHVLKNNNLPVDGKASSESMCDACQSGKMHKLPHHKLSSVSKFLLELGFLRCVGLSTRVSWEIQILYEFYR
jgi:hypothetical protein